MLLNLEEMILFLQFGMYMSGFSYWSINHSGEPGVLKTPQHGCTKGAVKN